MDVILNTAAIGSILKSAAVQYELLRRAQQIAQAAGEGFEASVNVGSTRARASVITVTEAAREAEARTGALTRALDAGR
jgi:hypothetical protein